jgi:8-hydroxy-5-deazaflavin:NADPH oxidoreductase
LTLDTNIDDRRTHRNRSMETAMKVGILGGGNVATKLAALMASAGHDVVIGVRHGGDPARGHTASMEQAASHGDVVIIAIPFSACASALPPLADQLAGKVVADATNPLNNDWSPLLLGENNSAAQEIARLIPAAKVVKGFNMVFADIMTAQGLRRGNRQASVFLAGDDDAALARLADLARSIGFDPVAAGPLKLARYLEAMAHLNIAVAVGKGGGTNAAFIFDQVIPN